MVNLVQYSIGAIGVVIFVIANLYGLSTIVQTNTVAVSVADVQDMGRARINPAATLDTSRIDDLRGQGYTLAADSGELILVPGGAVLETTPMVTVPGTAYVIPEESPDGGWPLPRSAWLDNSPLYSGGWLLLVDDVQHAVTWRAPAVECGGDMDCVTKRPHVIPDGRTVAAYWSAWDVPHFPTAGNCTSVDWQLGGEDGGPIVPVDLNEDGVIDCGSDLELGA